MLDNLPLKRPLAFIDIETTGLKPNTDKIVEISILKIHPDGNSIYHSKRINPEIPIPPEATAIHGIANADVANEPSFRQYAIGIRDFLDGCDLSGFNIIKFDLPFLEAEFKIANVEFSRKNRQIIDCQVLYHLKEPRDLNAAYIKYCGKQLKNNHTAEADVTASAEILNKQLEIYPELPRTVEELCSLCYVTREDFIDVDGKFIWSDGEAICNFGKKHNGRSLKDIAKEDPGYLEWIAKADFNPEIKEIVNKALCGEFPKQI